MIRLFQFIKRFRLFFTFFILELISFYFLFQNNIYHHSFLFNTGLEISGTIHRSWSGTEKYFSLAKTNDSLAAENAILRKRLSAIENRFTGNLLPDTNLNFGFTYQPGHVINNSFRLKKNYITVDVGKRSHIEEMMGVISYEGIVGIVAGVSQNFCRVLSVLNTDFHVNAKIKEVGEVGSVTWDGKSFAHVVLNDIPRHVRIEKGQHVLVGPYSKIFPENYPIGTIESFTVSEGESFYHIVVSLSANIKNINHVYLTRNMLLDEQNKLENNLTDE